MMRSVEEYLGAHEHGQLRNGKSGAKVWAVEGKYVLKYVRKEALSDPEMFSLYQNEARFYRLFQQGLEEELLCLPRVLDVGISDTEIWILMEKYEELSRESINEELLRKIMGVLAGVHVRKVPEFLWRERKEPEDLDDKGIESCLVGWRSVLAEHPGVFDEKILERAAGEFNDILHWHHGEAQVLSHGDFHWDNLLRKKNGDIVVCDWQGVGAGGASGDMSFFLSRLGADGVEIAPERAVKLYCQERRELTGELISSQELLRHMRAANVITSFQFWHEYLHGSSCERVRGIYEKMVMN